MKKKKIAAAVLLAAGVLIILFSGYKIFIINREYAVSAEFYNELASDENLTAEKTENDSKKKSPVDFNKLKSINPDIYAWLSIPAINVNYPVLQGENNDAYLHTLPDGTYNKGGSLFIDGRCNNDFSSFVTVIYGHCMKDNSMFGLLNRFLDKSFLKENNTFKIYTPEKTITPKITACFETSEKSDIYKLPTAENGEEYLNLISDISGEDFSSVDIKSQKIIILSTCSFSFDGARTVVVAVY